MDIMNVRWTLKQRCVSAGLAKICEKGYTYMDRKTKFFFNFFQKNTLKEGLILIFRVFATYTWDTRRRKNVS